VEDLFPLSPDIGFLFLKFVSQSVLINSVHLGEHTKACELGETGDSICVRETCHVKVPMKSKLTNQ